ncbi:MAG: hypothetical protein ACLFTE_06440 [Salinivenus sp.]
MFTRSAFRFDPAAIAGSFVVGVVFVVLLAWMNGSAFGAATFPLLAMTSGFILAGAAYGYLSKGRPGLEPVVTAGLVSGVSYVIITALDLQAFEGLVNEGTYTYTMVIAFLNGLVLTVAGAWAGEKLRRTYAGRDATGALEWGWIVAGTILGLAVSLFLANVVIWLFGLSLQPSAALEADHVWAMLFVVVPGLLATGYVCAFRSPGDTSYEAAVAGLITLILLIDVFVFTLAGESILTYTRMLLVLVVGLLASLLGGYVGERAQMEAEGPRPSEV